LTRAGGPYEPDLGYDEQRPRAETMRGFLAWLDQQEGAEEWLVGHGLARSRVDDFRAAMSA